jgi:uncharacterized damage-inducible protein DinB
MIDKAYLQKMSRYNRWQNENLFGAADGLSDAERKRERGAFWGSIHGTLNHILWADRAWMHRFAHTPKVTVGIKGSAGLHDDWDELKRERVAFDRIIDDWIAALDPQWIKGDLTYFSGAANRELTLPKWVLVTHFFNHQTHHRGQVHAMLTAAGAKPGDTDIPFMP